VLTDFDGTLAPIVDDPASSAPLPGAVDTLHRLAAEFATVAVVSGRRCAFLAEVLEIGRGRGRSPLQAFGLYGAERVDADGNVTTDPGPQLWREAIAAAANELRDLLPAQVAVEAKDVAATVHWRVAPERGEAAEQVARALAGRHGLSVRNGRMSVELVPPSAPDKGGVVRALAAGSEAACFLGDDVGDLAAFRALAELARTSPTRAVRVAVASDESPPGLVDEADVVLDGPEAALEFLERLARTARQA
jgi:trehalose 6-phosphate phosphatase